VAPDDFLTNSSDLEVRLAEASAETADTTSVGPPKGGHYEGKEHYEGEEH
jgi:hypothetical protein